MKVDFTIATRNSEKTIEQCIRNIQQNVPKSVLHHIIVVDNESTDVTRTIVARIAKEDPRIVLHVQSGFIGAVRLRQAEECDTDWIVIVDSDVYIYESWWNDISPHLLDDSMGLAIGMLDNKYSEPYRSFFTWTMKSFPVVAFSNTAIRRDLLLAARNTIKNLHGNEDAPVFELIRSKGLKTINVRHEPMGIHEGDADNLLKSKMIRSGQSVRIRRGFWPALLLAFKFFFTNQAKVLIYVLSTKKIFSLPTLSWTQFMNSLNHLIGVLSMKNIVREIK